MHKVGWHLGNSPHAMVGADWSIINSVPPASITFISGERVSGDDIRRILKIDRKSVV